MVSPSGGLHQSCDNHVTLIEASSILKVKVEFSLEQPVGGVHFSSLDHSTHSHVFTYGWINSSRLWFPCIDSYSELCTWDLSYTVPSPMVAVSCGDLTEQVLSADGRKKTYNYSITVPTSSSCIGFAIGMFEIYPDPVMSEVTHFCPPQLLPVLKNTVQFIHEVFGFYEELLSTRFPHSSYKLIFVNGCYSDAMNYAGLTVSSVDLLHSHRIIDQAIKTRKILSLAIAQQYFECYLLPQSWSDWWLSVSISRFITGLYYRKTFGSTDYQCWINAEHQRVCQYEQTNHLPPLCEVLTKGVETPPTNLFHPHMCSEKELSILCSKGHLVIRMLQLKIGHDLLVQVFNKLLTLASTAAMASEYSQWIPLHLSTAGFLKLVLTVSGKDLSYFMEQWVGHNGSPILHTSYNYIRKKNIIELQLTQDVPRGNRKFVVN
jgi:transcription initiation factor TFIID subunit 2